LINLLLTGTESMVRWPYWLRQHNVIMCIACTLWQGGINSSATSPDAEMDVKLNIIIIMTMPTCKNSLKEYLLLRSLGHLTVGADSPHLRILCFLGIGLVRSVQCYYCYWQTNYKLYMMEAIFTINGQFQYLYWY